MSSFTNCHPQNAAQSSRPDGASYMQLSPVMAAPSMHFVPMNHQNLQPLSQSIETIAHIHGQTNFVPEVMLPNGMNMRPVGLLNGELLYKVTAPSTIAAPLPANVPKLKKKTKKMDDQVKDQAYVKKPLNAFMLFSKEHRQAVKAKSASTNIAVINESLGKMWHLLTDKEKAKYYEKADEERRRHAQQHPDWSCRHNYGKKKYHKRSKESATAAPASEIVEIKKA
ncbi:transcription factor 7-like 2 isoform X2 [Corythoichthys intestinalis]|nr:transcription factor 7-like 2 isoform X2 [Corythoichthys intestinalis]